MATKARGAVVKGKAKGNAGTQANRVVSGKGGKVGVHKVKGAARGSGKMAGKNSHSGSVSATSKGRGRSTSRGGY
jgi:hypothetical protein